MLDTNSVSPQMKFCHVCKQTKPLEAFCNNRSRYDGKQSNCKACDNTYQSIRYKSRKRKTATMRTVGFSQKDYDHVYEQQKGLCAICGKPETGKNQFGRKKLAIDHDHRTGKFRGLLCQICNTRLGILEDEAFVESARRYLLQE